MKCFIAIDEDLLLKLWMLDPQLVAPFSRADTSKRGEGHLAVDDETQIDLPIPENTSRIP